MSRRSVHIQQQCQSLTNILSRQAAGATSKAKVRTANGAAKQQSRGESALDQAHLARQAERQAVQLSGMSKR